MEKVWYKGGMKSEIHDIAMDRAGTGPDAHTPPETGKNITAKCWNFAHTAKLNSTLFKVIQRGFFLGDGGVKRQLREPP